MHSAQTIIEKCIPIKIHICHFIQRHLKLLKRAFFKLCSLWYQTCYDYLMICGINNKIYLNLKGIILKQLHLISRVFLDFIIIVHINTPWKNCFIIVAYLAQTHWYWYKQPLMDILWAKFESLPMCNFCMTPILKVLAFLNCEYIPMGTPITR